MDLYSKVQHYLNYKGVSSLREWLLYIIYAYFVAPLCMCACLRVCVLACTRVCLCVCMLSMCVSIRARECMDGCIHVRN